MLEILLSPGSLSWGRGLLCIFSAFVVGLSGVVPLLFLPLDSICSKKDVISLNRWLSYATGSLLGEVFIHLLPESWINSDIDAFQIPGLWILGGLLLFFIIEKLCIHDSAEKEVEGYLNLAANVIDNFTHGVAIAGSYLVSLRLGILTTTCILVHEVPHEMADFVILLRSGFSRWEAAKAQLATASGSTLGAILTLCANASVTGCTTKWILPFTAGGFLYIALVSLLPDILKELSFKESIIHLSLMFFGLTSMAVVSYAMD
uniref:Putative solute carrier family 39 (zinc transporter) n=1 Tax=Schistosoma mansoni TaxID=6183 RepID=A0A3Q0KS68_SCHMA